MTLPKIVNVAAAVIERPDGRFLLGQRAADTFYAGFWEFPGGKIEVGETAHAALIRELNEELGIDVTRADPWLRREHVYEHAHVRLHFFRVREWSGEICDHVHSALSWERPDNIMVGPMLPANAPVLAALALPDFYAITQATELGPETQLNRLEHALENGLRLLQIREPAMDPVQRFDFSRAAVLLCHQFGARVLINRDFELAQACGADGVHLSAGQIALCAERPPFALVAASCHNAAELRRAAKLGCDFALLGPVKPTATHPEQIDIGWPRFAAEFGRDAVPPLPTFALGGLGAFDLDTARRYGAHGIAAIRAAWT